MNEYYGYQQNDYRNYLMHYGKGQKAKNHKYIDIVNGRYIYPEDKGSRSKIDTTKSQNRVNSNYGYHIRAKQINAYLRKQDSNFATVNGESASNTIRKTPFKKAARKSNKLNSNSSNESNKKLNQKRLGLRSYLVKDKAKGLISSTNSKSLSLTSALKKLKGGKSKVSALLDTSMQKVRSGLHRAKTNTKIAIGNTKAKARTAKRNLPSIYNKAMNALRGAGSTIRRNTQSALIKAKNRKDQSHDVITWFTQPKQTVHKGKDFTLTTRSGLGANRKRGVYASRKSR